MSNTRGQHMEVDRANPFDDYRYYKPDAKHRSLVLSCYWCNNAKTDEFTYEEFKDIGKAIKAVWDSRGC